MIPHFLEGSTPFALCACKCATLRNNIKLMNLRSIFVFKRMKDYALTYVERSNRGEKLMSWPTEKDIAMLEKLPKETLLNLFFLHVKNLWRVDGLYFLGIEERFKTEEATKIDAKCWEIMGKIEARELKKTLNLQGNGVAELVYALENSSWALYQIEKESTASNKKGLFRVTRCRTQQLRIKNGLGEFPCKQVRFGYLKNFTNEFNPKINVTCRTCPPDSHTNRLWCEWEFTLQE